MPGLNICRFSAAKSHLDRTILRSEDLAAAGRNVSHASLSTGKDIAARGARMVTMANRLPGTTARRVGGAAPTVFHGFKAGIAGFLLVQDSKPIIEQRHDNHGARQPATIYHNHDYPHGHQRMMRRPRESDQFSASSADCAIVDRCCDRPERRWDCCRLYFGGR